MTALRSRRHAIFTATLMLYISGVCGAVGTGCPSLMTVTTFLIAVAAWSYGPRVALLMMILGHVVSAAVLTRLSDREGIIILHPVAMVIPIALMEGLLLVGLSSLRCRELQQEVVEAELRCKNAELKAALEEVRELRGLLPICAWCKSIRDVDGMWNQLESYLVRHSGITFTHGMCPDCLSRELARPRSETPVGSPDALPTPR